MGLVSCFNYKNHARYNCTTSYFLVDHLAF